MRTIGAARDARLTSVLLVAAACSVAPAKEPSITPASLSRIGVVDCRCRRVVGEMRCDPGAGSTTN
jgi:hypothetical protein